MTASSSVSLVRVAVCRLPHAIGFDLPAYATAGAAGVDFQAAVEHEMLIAPGKRALVPTGLKLALPAGYELQIRPRSGLALKHGIMVPNSPGTIDDDYRGEIMIILMNAGDEDFRVVRGMRIAQGVIAPVTRLAWEECEILPPTQRGANGFGSTGS